MHATLEESREKINVLNVRILRLLIERAYVAEDIGQWKRQQGKPVRDPERELALLKEMGRLCDETDPRLRLHILLAFRGLIESSVVLQGDHVRPEGPLYCILCKWKTAGITHPDFDWPVCPCCGMPLSSSK